MFVLDDRKPKMNRLNYDVLRNIFDYLDLTDILSVQRVCTRFKEEADFMHPSSKFELHSVVNGRLGNSVNWLKEAESILKRYGGKIPELDVDYNCLKERNDHEQLARIVHASCRKLLCYTVRGSLRYPTIRIGQLFRPNFHSLNTLRLCNFSSSTTDIDVVAYLKACKKTLRSLRVENMWLTGQFLKDVPNKLESLELINMHDIEMHHILAYMNRNPTLKRFEYVTRGLVRFMPTAGFFDKFTKLEHLKVHVDNQSHFMLPLNFGLLSRFPMLKTLDLDSRKSTKLIRMFKCLEYSPMLERLSITLSRPIQYYVLRSLKRLSKLNYLKVNFYTMSAADRMDNLWPTVKIVTELEVTSYYGCNVSKLCASMPDIKVVNFKFREQCTGLESIAWLKNLSKFEVRISGIVGIAILNRLMTELIKARPIKNLTVSRLSSTKYRPILTTQFNEQDAIESKSSKISDALKLDGITDFRTFEVSPVEVINLFQLMGYMLRDQNRYEVDEIMLAGEVEEIHQLQRST